MIDMQCMHRHVHASYLKKEVVGGKAVESHRGNEHTALLPTGRGYAYQSVHVCKQTLHHTGVKYELCMHMHVPGPISTPSPANASLFSER